MEENSPKDSGLFPAYKASPWGRWDEAKGRLRRPVAAGRLWVCPVGTLH